MNILNKLWNKGQEFLGTKYAILGGAMSWVSERNLVSAISNAGGFGVLAGGSMPPELLLLEIEATKSLTNYNFGVNLIVMHPQLIELIEVCISSKVTHIVLAGGLPNSLIIDKIKNSGIKILCFAPTFLIAKKLVKLGVDAIIIEGMEAGGHIGPVSTLVLVQEIVPYIKEVPIFVAGGIANGQVIASLLQLGASGCQIGTHFVCTQESIAHPNFKKKFIKSNARNATISMQLDEEFAVIPVRAIENQATKNFSLTQRQLIDAYRREELSKSQAQLKIEHYWAGALKKAVIEGNIEQGSVMAGQSVGMVKNIKPTKFIIEELVNQAQAFLEYNYLLAKDALNN